MTHDEQRRRIRNLRAQLRYRATTCTRSEYYWPGTATLDPYTRRYGNADLISKQLAHLREAARYNDVQEYCRTWATLNHLKGE